MVSVIVLELFATGALPVIEPFAILNVPAMGLSAVMVTLVR